MYVSVYVCMYSMFPCICVPVKIELSSLRMFVVVFVCVRACVCMISCCAPDDLATLVDQL